ncbi:LodA/GoxA family CTQ-dependent oxidase [Kitasatospora sp. NPDC057015]|uniref:LodA/GoxA family CTQ-dependent oxidase n=1 Tax=Kitasatospora sp. NPDC057015 TaxID=3346001 RepID=UPI00362C5639
MNPDDIAYCEIHPTLGVARVGNSPDGWFVGPETPGTGAHPEAGYKDPQGRVKRQAARFRVYGYDKDHNVLGEVTAEDADLQWSVELANAKAAWYRFHGRFNRSEAPDNLRNQSIDPADPQARATLVIKPGPRSVSGPDADGRQARFDTGTFLGIPVALGELRTDEAGRLLVLGGYGHSASAKPDNPLTTYANNDFWHDDTSDGPVSATVTVAGGRSIPVTPAWVLVAPPDFAPDTENIVTLYDVAREVAEGEGWLTAPPEVSFTRDVLPLLDRISGYQWVNLNALRGHGPGEQGDFRDPDLLAALASNAPGDAVARNTVFRRLRTPGAEDVTQANYAFMPQLAGDDGDPIEGKPRTWFTLLPGQYERMRRWAAGDFTADHDPDASTTAEPAPLADLPVAEQPHALVRAALEPCVGGPFFPGIEMTYIADDPATWSGAFRLRAGLAAGDVTKHMAVPWQADFYECHTHWWPAQRPDDVLPEEQYRSLIRAAGSPSQPTELDAYRKPWARGVGTQAVYRPELERRQGETTLAYLTRMNRRWQLLRDHAGDNEMVEKWSSLGFVVARTGAAGETVLVETERARQVGLTDREWFYMLQHPDRFPQQVEAAAQYVEGVLAHAVARQADPLLPLTLRPFRYTQEAFEARLQLIYTDLVRQAENYNPAQDPIFRNRPALIERIRQFAPFNLLDGAWLRNATPVGPISDIHALLFSIWVDEVGGGDPALNHSNLYHDLLRSVGLYLPPVDSYDFAMQPDMLDSAYTLSAFQLAISLYSERFFPEILGMTLQLEWEVVGIKPTAELFDYYGVDSRFYKMHVGIDNAASGHGAKARDAVARYLEAIYDAGGDEAVQQQWQRIWTGYVAFQDTGTIGEDILRLALNPPTAEDRLVEMITRKAPYASVNHDGKQLGDNRLNDWFLDPSGLLVQLQESGLILPGDPEGSPFFELTSFTGPMYKVFTESELALWHEWTRSLTDGPPPTPPVLSPLQAMIKLVETLRQRQTGTPGHIGSVITGPDPMNPAVTRKDTVAWWFTQPTGSLLAAISHPDNRLITPGRPEQSSFVTDLLSPGGSMGRAFEAVVPGTGKSGREIAVEWITAGCPLPDLSAPQARVLLSTPFPVPAVGGAGVGAAAPADAAAGSGAGPEGAAPGEADAQTVRPRITGMGAVH